MKTEVAKCKCGCGKITQQWGDYVPGHDLVHRNRLIDEAGGVDKLTELLNFVNDYVTGKIGESELANGIRRNRAIR